MRYAWFLLLLLMKPLAAKPVEIILWHSLAGQLGQEIQTLANGFNQSQHDVAIKPIYKGDYVETLSAFAAAFQAKQAPALVQVFEVGTASMLQPRGVIKPVDELMKEQGMPLPETSFFPALRAFYSKKGHLMAMPFNVSIPVIFYNAKAVAKVGYDAASFPKTWDELEILAAKLRKAGYACAYTSAYPAWILIESYAAIHGLSLTDSHLKQANFNQQQAFIQHLQRLLRWQDLHYFEYGGRQDDAVVLFTSGRCPLLSQSSGSYNGLAQLVPFPLGMAALPLDSQVSSQRFNNVTGGAALWVVKGQKPAVYRGIAQFFAYLSRPQVQQSWHQRTGYLPLGIGGIYQQLALDSQHPSLHLAKEEWQYTNRNTSLHFDAQNQIRMINEEALEAVFARIKSPKQAMDDAAERANRVLRRQQIMGVG
jgi:sn-glycerol 3-phosphate transport system substrate-binding protein